jgi:hypothetical protein
MAHVSAFVFDSAPTSWNRYQSAAGFVAAFIGATDLGYVHAGRHSGQARGAKRCRATPSIGRIGASCCTYSKQFTNKHSEAKIHALAVGVAPFCTYADQAIRPLSLLGSMAGTTGLEPATSAVTGQRSNQLSYVPSFLFFDLMLSLRICCLSLLSTSISRFHFFHGI